VANTIAGCSMIAIMLFVIYGLIRYSGPVQIVMSEITFGGRPLKPVPAHALTMRVEKGSARMRVERGGIFIDVDRDSHVVLG
jgi:hypothetical protein